MNNEDQPTLAQLDEMQRDYEEKVMPGLQSQAATNLILQCRTVAERHSLGQQANDALRRRVQEQLDRVVKAWKKEMTLVGEFDVDSIFVTARFMGVDQNRLDLLVSPEVAKLIDGKSSIRLLMPDAPIRKFAPAPRLH